MQDISLHILDIVENAITAKATQIDVRITEDQRKDLLTIIIEDNGIGMDEISVHSALDPFWSTKPGKRIGLGLPFLAQAARESGGTLSIESRPKVGTKIVAEFARSHPDRKPLGDIHGTIRLLEKTHPEVSFTLRYNDT